MITKLSPVNIVGLMMGIFFFFTAIGEFLAGKIGALMSIPKNIVEANNPVLSLPYYANVLLQISIYSAGIGVLIFFLVPVLKKWMADIR
jgi:POT family proton-dependent oligopeptide transporter